ncbi:UPF0280 family protein [Pseudodesulfovibrio sp. zrk46]|uniref:UPF0280 family protein n=1 Tax=Pseudodesulfovibrio sp. zrk46 TaxID=2725288 RepID=UPI001448E7B6|nr:UPF0280 family protein [Pseudodesulfovibrio sp. zrk46]QJB55188.1 UPF0280 family protein [Pseudodesulfovibrio sp. zrk46]
MKKPHLSAERSYRDSVRPQEGEIRFQVAVEQTDLLIVAEKDLRHEIASYVSQVRGEIKNWIMFHPEFADSLAPLPMPDEAPPIIRAMIAAVDAVGVGPMAAVAGAVAQAVGDRFVSESPNLLVENGGDTYMHSTRERVVALLAEPDSGAMVGLKVEADAFPVAVCASSGVIGHSLSLGNGDLVAVRAKDARFADAAATALCNLLRSEADIDKVLKVAQQLTEYGLEGVFAQYDDKLAAWGELELVALD